MRETTDTKTRTIVSACTALLLAAGAWHVGIAEARDDDRSRNDLRVIGLTDEGRLVSFRAQSPERTRQIGYITGFTGTDTALVGIDFRVQDGKLYGVGNGGGRVHDRFENRRGDVRQRADRTAGGNDVRRRLQSGRRPSAHHQRHRPEPRAQRERRRRHRPQCDADLHDSTGHARGACAGRHRGCLHEQRSESAEHGYDAVRCGHDAGPGRDSVASGQRHSGRDRQARRRRRAAAGFDIYSLLRTV